MSRKEVAKPPKGEGAEKKPKQRVSIFRVLFWALFLSAVGGTYFWVQSPLSVPQRVKWHVKRMQHPNPHVAYPSWVELNNLYYSYWAATEPILDQTSNSARISFLVRAVKIPVPGKKARDGFSANDKPYYYKTDQLHCRTVGEAILAFMYNEVDNAGKPRWRKDYQGDWATWWAENQGHYGR